MARGVMQLEWLFYEWYMLSQPSWTVLEIQTVIFCCKWLTLSLHFWYCKNFVSVHLMPTHHRTELHTTRIHWYFSWIIEVGEGGKGEQSYLSWGAELMFSQQASHPVLHFHQFLHSLLWHCFLIHHSYQQPGDSHCSPSPSPHWSTQVIWHARVTQGKSE